MAKHTPGPWEAQAFDEDNNGVAIIAVHPDVPQGGTPTRGMVAYVTSMAGAAFDNRPVAEANGRLIAEAPALLDALEGLIRYCDAARYTAGMGPSQIARLETARAVVSRVAPEPHRIASKEARHG